MPVPSEDRVELRCAITETGRGRLQHVNLNLQLCLNAGEPLETEKTKFMLGEQRIELSPDQIGGWIRHRGWELRVDSAASLVWPVLPFNPYRNAPETDLQHAVGVLTVPVQVDPPQADAPLDWRSREINFTLDVPAIDK